MSPTIAGQVRGSTGEPVPGARVVVESAPGAVPDIAILTDADGRFTLGTVGAGDYLVAAHADGYEPTRAAVVVVDTPVSVDLRMTKTPG